jgi:hypothetical protein
MGSPFKDHHTLHPSLARKLIPWTFYAMLPLVLFRVYLYPYPLHHTTTTILTSSSVSPPPALLGAFIYLQNNLRVVFL